MEYTTPFNNLSQTNDTHVKEIMQLSLAAHTLLTMVYLAGVVGNVSALIILFHEDKVSNNEI